MDPYFVLASENINLYADKLQRANDTFRPQGEVEELLVQNAMTSLWRVLRCEVVESVLIDHETTQLGQQIPMPKDPCAANILKTALAISVSVDQSGILQFLGQAENRYQRSADRSLRLLMALQKHRRESEEMPKLQNEPNSETGNEPKLQK